VVLLHEIQPLVVERHFRDLQQRYGDVLAIDLINQVYILLSLFQMIHS
jgi:hypothetical protein